MRDRKKFCLLLCVVFNIIVILGSCFRIGNEHQETVVFNDVSWNNIESIESLERGVYDVTLRYETNAETYYVYLDASEEVFSSFLSDDFILNPYKNELSFQIWLNAPVRDFKIHVSDSGMADLDQNKYLALNQISVVRSRLGSWSYEILKIFMWLIFLDAIAFIYFIWDVIRSDFMVMCGLFCVIMISSLGTMTSVLPVGHDIQFHLARIYGLAGGIRLGDFPVRIQPDWIGGYGYPVSVFYGDALLYFPAVLYILKVPLIYAYKIYVCGINVATVLVAYYCFKKISGNKYIGVVTSSVYSLSIYRISNLYLRAAVGEYTAMLFLPLVILGMWEIFTADSHGKGYKHKWIILCIGMSGLIQSHILSCEMVIFFLVMTCLFLIRSIFKKKVLSVLVKSVVAVLCLNAGFLLSFLEYAGQSFKIFNKNSFYKIQQYGLSIFELFTVGTTGYGVAQTNQMGQKIPLSLGFSVMLIIVSSIIIMIYCRQWKQGEKKQFIFALGMAGAAIVLSTNVFPWDRLGMIPALKMLVGALQFPFRFMAIAMVFIALLTCLMLCKLKEVVSEHWYKIVMAGLCIICAYQSLQFEDYILRNTDSYVKYDGAEWVEVTIKNYGDAYCYEGTDVGEALRDSSISGTVEILNVDRKDTDFTVTCKGSEEGYLELPIFYYPGYQCVDIYSGLKYSVGFGENNKLRVELPDDYEGTIQVSFVEPWYWRGAEALSLITLVYIGISIGIRKKSEMANA